MSAKLYKITVIALLLAALGPAAAKPGLARENKDLLTLTILVRDGMAVLWHHEADAGSLALEVGNEISRLGLDKIPKEELKLSDLIAVLESAAVKPLVLRVEIYRPLSRSGSVEGAPNYRLRDLELRGVVPPLEFLAPDTLFHGGRGLSLIAGRWGWSIAGLESESAPAFHVTGKINISGQGPGALAVVLP